MVIEVDPKLMLEATIVASIQRKPNRLHGVFLDVAQVLLVEKREVRDALQRLRKQGRVEANLSNGEWTLGKVKGTR